MAHVLLVHVHIGTDKFLITHIMCVNSYTQQSPETIISGESL